MSWIPLAERFAALPLILAGPILRRVSPQSVTVWLALREPRTVILRVYQKDDKEELIQRFEGTHHSVRLGDHLHVVAVNAHPAPGEEALAWGECYYYDLFFPSDDETEAAGIVPSTTTAHLGTPGILSANPTEADPLHRLVYPGEPLPSFVLPPRDIGKLRIIHGSCRKPHGAGREMLSLLDDVLASTIGESTMRPQMLFLTGDQIYADDVASPLLFMLIDAGCVLLVGNEEEILPSLNIPARMLPPGERREAVHNTALLTTTTPQNHLLSLAEYACMYLFTWSDVLWPPDLPTAQDIWHEPPRTQTTVHDREKVEGQCDSNLECLERFRSTLPQVRRVLANIATYTICDDHEITDDWYLDGAWCRQVLSNALGRHIIRNALLAYALFQAWGNTPEQFADERGKEFLGALDMWRGDESDSRAETIATLLGLPAPFAGSGELQRSERAFHWYYIYSGPRFQVIVMDTRTQRLYLSSSEFPGLLSPSAMREQITEAARKDVEATVIISATPVLGIDFIESIQFWSRWRVRDNYAYDREAWALEWGTFQHFLKTVSALLRVVFLSGDVHYAFASSMEYWDHHTRETARLVDFTSSALCNEGAGSHIAVLAVGYPRLLHLLRHQDTPTVDFFAWDIHDDNHHLADYILTLIRRRLYRFWWAIPRLIAIRRSPFEIILPARGWLKGTFDVFPPDRSYRLRYLRNTLARQVPAPKSDLRSFLLRLLLMPVRIALNAVTFIESQISRSRNRWQRRTKKIEQAPGIISYPAGSLARRAIQRTETIERRLERRRNRLVETIFRYATMLNRWKAGELIIGYNNIGEVSFDWSAEKREVVQRLWWYRPGDDNGEPEWQLKSTEYRDTLALPKPELEPPLP